MARGAVTQEIVRALRQEIRRIEDAPPPALVPSGRDCPRAASAGENEGEILRTGSSLDDVLGGGLPRAALLEVHGAAARDAGAVAGFAFGLAALSRREGPAAPLLWVSAAGSESEAGLPYAPGLAATFGLGAGDLLLASLPKLADGLWIAEEAAALPALSAVILAVRGSPQPLDLRATRRLHLRARAAGRPVILLRLGTGAIEPEPTAAPVRLLVSPAPASPRRVFGVPLERSIGPPAFRVRLSKGRAALSGELVLEWNPDDRRFNAARPPNPGAVVPAPGRGTRVAGAAGAVLAFEPREAAPGHEPQGAERVAHRLRRRAG